MPLLEYDLNIDAGTDFQRVFCWKTSTVETAVPSTPVSFSSGWSAIASIRRMPNDASALLSISTTPSTAGKIVFGYTPGSNLIDLTNGNIFVWFTAVGTSGIPTGLSYTQQFVWELILTDPHGIKIPFALGAANVNALIAY